MAFNHTLSALLRGIWLLEPAWAKQHYALAGQLVRGEQINLGTQTENKEDVNPIQMAAAGYKVGRYTELDRLPEGSVAIVDVIGPVTRYGGSCSYGLEDKATLLRSLANSPNISGIVLNTNSPGGEASGTAAFAGLIKSITAKKPVIGFVEDGMAASAAMWFISACTEIYASNQLSSFGSIGAYTVLIDETKALEAEGVIVKEIYAPQSGDKNKDYRDALEGDESGIKARLGILVDHFISDVTANRKGLLNLSAGDPFTGKMFFAPDAQSIGLINGISSLEQAIGRVSELAAKKNSTSNSKTNMKGTKYTRLAAAAGWEAGYEAPKDGLHINHDEATTIEAALEQGATDAAAVAAHAVTIADHATAIEAKDAAISDLTKQLDTAKADADTQRALAVKYGAKESGTGTATITETDPVIEQNNTKKYGNDETSQAAMQMFNSRKK